tara:strand:- start:2440 stop:3288 length:849 start_codon:yes stop_codon:yes gene_type:complete
MSLDSYANLKLEIADHLERDDLTSQIDTFIDLAESRHKREVRIKEMMTRTFLLSSDTSTITGATAANPVVITTSADHNLDNGDRVYISGVAGMTQLNTNFYLISNKTSTTFELTDINGTSFSSYSSGGVVTVAGIKNRQEPLPEGYLETITLRLLTSPVTLINEVSYHEMNRLRKESTGKPTYYVVSNEFEFNYIPDSTYKAEIVYWEAQTALSSANTSNDVLVRAPDLYLYGALTAAEPFLMNDARIQTWAALYLTGLETLNTSDRRKGGLLVSRPAGMVY